MKPVLLPYHVATGFTPGMQKLFLSTFHRIFDNVMDKEKRLAINNYWPTGDMSPSMEDNEGVENLKVEVMPKRGLMEGLDIARREVVTERFFQQYNVNTDIEHLAGRLAREMVYFIIECAVNGTGEKAGDFAGIAIVGYSPEQRLQIEIPDIEFMPDKFTNSIEVTARTRIDLVS